MSSRHTTKYFPRGVAVEVGGLPAHRGKGEQRLFSSQLQQRPFSHLGEAQGWQHRGPHSTYEVLGGSAGPAALSSFPAAPQSRGSWS